MVKIIKAHQEGDETTKKQIGNRVKQDREHRRLNSLNAKIKRGKQSLMFGRDSTQQVNKAFRRKVKGIVREYCIRVIVCSIIQIR